MKKITLLIILSVCVFNQVFCQKHHKRNHDNSRNRIQYDNNGELLEGMVSIIDIVYKNIDTKELALDIYKPNTINNTFPLLVWIHGGAWKRGDKKAFLVKNNTLVNALLKEGYAIASVEYRLSGDAVFPAQIQDCNDAIQFLFANADKYNIDKNNIGVMGRSAGGHLAELLAYSNHDNPESFSTQKVKFDIKVLVAFFAPSDLVNFKEDKNGKSSAKSPEARLLGDVPEHLPALAKQASPVTFIDTNSPPSILFHGKADRNVPFQQSERVKELLDENKINSELYLVDEARHSDPIFDTNKEVEKILLFLKNTL